MTVDLPRPVGPGEEVTVELEFTTQLPRVVARTGYSDDFHAVAQWYPKIGVLAEENGWQAHTFSLSGEFYADFGDYRVELDGVSALELRIIPDISGGTAHASLERLRLA